MHHGAVGKNGYILGNSEPGMRERLDNLAVLANPGTFEIFARIGVGSGWSCWEVGAGSPSVPTRLAQEVGPAGRVLATDIDTTWLVGPDTASYEVRTHEVGTDQAPDELFDLVHARIVLMHVPEREQALADMAACVRPGGWLVIEDGDSTLQPLTCPNENGPNEHVANKLHAAMRNLMAQRGVDLAWGRTLPRRLRELGLVDVEAQGSFGMTSAVTNNLERASITRIRSLLIEQGLATEDEIDECIAAMDAGELDICTPVVVSAWARKPA